MFQIADQLIALGERKNLSLRKCSICGYTKPTSEFSIKDKAKGYLDTRCKPCKSDAVMALKAKKKNAVN